MTAALELLGRARCDLAERQSLIPLCGQLIQLAEISRRDGLLALEPIQDGLGDSLLKTGLRLVVDGTDPNRVEEILLARTIHDDQAPRSLLANLLVVVAVQALWKGENPRTLQEVLAAWAGLPVEALQPSPTAPIRSVADDQFDQPLPPDFEPEAWLTSAEFRRDWDFEDLRRLPNSGVQKLWQTLAFDELTAALCGASDGLRNHFGANLSSRAVEKFKESLRQRAAAGLARATQEKVLAEVAHLIEEGALLIRKE